MCVWCLLSSVCSSCRLSFLPLRLGGPPPCGFCCFPFSFSGGASVQFLLWGGAACLLLLWSGGPCHCQLVSMPLSFFVLKTEIGQFVSIKCPFPLWWQSPHFHLLRLTEVSPFLTVRRPVSFRWLLCLSSFSSGRRPQGKGKKEVEYDSDCKIKFCAMEIGKDPERKRMI